MQEIIPLEICRHNCIGNKSVAIWYVKGSFVAETSASSPSVPCHMHIFSDEELVAELKANRHVKTRDRSTLTSDIHILLCHGTEQYMKRKDQNIIQIYDIYRVAKRKIDNRVKVQSTFCRTVTVQ